MACQDLAGTAKPADFDFFEYRDRPFRPNLTDEQCFASRQLSNVSHQPK
jgi:hypothetical protein